MEKTEKYKTIVVSKLFAETETPFTKQVIDHPLPNKFKTPQIPSYSGVGDLIEHLENYRMHLTLHVIPDEIACKAFPTTLSENPREWFRSLTPNSVGTFEDLARIFLTHFLGSRERKKPSEYLLMLHQREGESLKEFMIRFNAEKLKVEDPTKGVIFSAIHNGISFEELVARKIARRQPNDLQELLHEVEEFINEEETLKAMRSARKTPKKLEEKKMRDHSGTRRSETLQEEVQQLQFHSAQRQHFRGLDGNKKRSGISKTSRGSTKSELRSLLYPREERARQEEPRRRLARLTSEPHNRANILEIHTIVGRFAEGSRRSEIVIGFSDADYVGISYPQIDALVVTLIVANHNVHRILVDNESLANILYWFAFKKLNLGQEKIVPTSCPLMGFIGEQVQPVISIELPITAGSYPRNAMVMIHFLLVNRPSAYNAIIGRTALNELRAITSTPHLKMKFSTDHGVGEVRGN
ncbi:uncharacterized protein LOC132185298 [Corylus avellana]|uniref:uncharacterized protein LOC132185298 n=1 Tax=Corylus avellana TaxID=13451 RepID=UPI00286C4194|nr:uncharacterized protein LOC132185298 [Corylus avellana]